jgi:stearoyl-CoA desaturase (delta-9 desaturase)
MTTSGPSSEDDRGAIRTAAEAAATIRSAATVRGSVSLRRVQRLHAFALNIVPAVGFLAAVWMALTRELSVLPVVACAAMYFITMTGMTVGFHRLLSHSSFRASPVTLATLTIFGSMAAQGPPIYWVANHRRHHQFSDDSGDPHSPRAGGLAGFWHAHVSWMFTHDITNVLRYCKDLVSDPIVAKINRHYYAIVLTGLLLPAVVVGAILGTWHAALEGFLCGGLARLFLTHHATSCINSVTHMFGQRRFAVNNDSRNSGWLAIPTLGEAWHNNHHAFPGAAFFGQTWTQIDVGGVVISALVILRLASDAKRTSAETILRRGPAHDASIEREESRQ